MSRLLHAAARGARLQFKLPEDVIWYETSHRPSRNHDLAKYRIHPKDEALQYGPISSALREFAEKGREPYTLPGYAAIKMFRYECWYPFVLAAEWPHAQMFALILAEALADEGL